MLPISSSEIESNKTNKEFYSVLRFVPKRSRIQAIAPPPAPLLPEWELRRDSRDLSLPLVFALRLYDGSRLRGGSGISGWRLYKVLDNGEALSSAALPPVCWVFGPAPKYHLLDDCGSSVGDIRPLFRMESNLASLVEAELNLSILGLLPLNLRARYSLRDARPL